MTNRSRGVSNTRCSAIVNSTTPRFGPRCPPVCERTLISSSRTSWASCGRLCSRSALMSAGERIPSSKRVGAATGSDASEEFDFIICVFVFSNCIGRCRRFRRCFEVFNHSLARAVAANDFNLLLRLGKSFLANLYQIHSFFVLHNQIFQRQFARFHLLDNFFEPIHRALKVKLCFALLRFAAHGKPGIKHSTATEQRATSAERHGSGRRNWATGRIGPAKIDRECSLVLLSLSVVMC